MLFNLINPNQDLFENFFEDINKLNPFVKTNNIMKTDIQEQDKQYIISVEVPGFKKEDVKVALENGYLTIEANNSHEKEEKEPNFIRKERFKGVFKRSFYLDKNFDLKEMEGTLQEGILKLVIPKKTIKQPEKQYLELK
ncbi:molecular chaperone [Candidatus Phytoplasma pruni]|uniref:Molecular chaperone n=1 Tax=Candidatus Phytoplasma pruni TaxID=479893 RepID=A0A0M1MZX4_9MOLU|nr:Hsp20/alpha crystallin family protein [Candidatus Phytoplasma pruni]KOR75274.1 molecular chaperone [Candidatus Phytoplasma pruni]MCQ9618503.1 Hsp20/alpha crystallin family protein [Candidatus Phytoplasma pruni]MDW3617490.1 Hsp20/alpha crystallin family protein [Candidatus Phytoplasma pruni]